ncbi:piggyBac transposable element-derived protein 4 [Biomphalaria glabrata]|nr:piggyBac transposable element-derived protein 4 [Biomphalaria glabrata]
MASSSDSSRCIDNKYRCIKAEEASQMILFDSESDDDRSSDIQNLDLELDSLRDCASQSKSSKKRKEPALDSDQNLLTDKFRKCFYPFQELSIDEMVIGFRGRWQYKMFNATKPSKYHIKTFGLCDSAMMMKWFLHKEKTMLCVAFKDKKAKKNVIMVSTDAEVGTAKVNDVDKPSMVDTYNRNMNGCDKLDRKVTYYCVFERKTIKWWKK